MHRVSKTVKIVFIITLSNFNQLMIFGTNMAKTIGVLFSPRLIYVNALPCETQMLQVVTLRGDYLYQIVYLCIINSTEDAT